MTNYQREQIHAEAALLSRDWERTSVGSRCSLIFFSICTTFTSILIGLSTNPTIAFGFTYINGAGHD